MNRNITSTISTGTFSNRLAFSSEKLELARILLVGFEDLSILTGFSVV